MILTLLFSTETTSLSRYIIPCNAKLLSVSRDSAIAQVGVTERSGRNDGYQVEQYLGSVGLRKGNPYCAAGQYWCFYSACKDLKLPLSAIPLYRTGSTVSMYNRAKKKGIKTKNTPKNNDLIFWKKASAWRGHVERIVKVKKAGWLRTIGFNTSSGRKGSQDNGEGVYYRNRNYYHFLGRLVVRGFVGFKAI